MSKFDNTIFDYKKDDNVRRLVSIIRDIDAIEENEWKAHEMATNSIRASSSEYYKPMRELAKTRREVAKTCLDIFDEQKKGKIPEGTVDENQVLFALAYDHQYCSKQRDLELRNSARHALVELTK